jgi:hypothetical protein
MLSKRSRPRPCRVSDMDFREIVFSEVRRVDTPKGSWAYLADYSKGVFY